MVSTLYSLPRYQTWNQRILPCRFVSLTTLLTTGSLLFWPDSTSAVSNLTQCRCVIMERQGQTYVSDLPQLLTVVQRGALLEFLMSRPGTKCPLPILPDETNTYRVDPEEPISVTGVYRDPWEREMPPPEWMGDGRPSSCIRNSMDCPTMMD